MLLQAKEIDGITLVTINDQRLDANVAGEFKEQLGELIRRGHSVIALGMSQVRFIDSSGLGAIVTCLKQLGTKGQIVVYDAGDSVRKLFSLTRMDKVFTLYPNQDAALAAFRD